MWLCPSHAAAIGLATPFTFYSVFWGGLDLNFPSSVAIAFEVCGWAC